MSKHTPGPWFAEEMEYDYGPTGDFFIYPYKQKGRRMPIATIQEPFNGKRTEANVRLIAAAPELLETLRLVAKLSYGSPHNHAIQERVRAVIAKVEGGDQ